ncbi:MAG: DUF485 domain-containing protein [Gammaproteobacteria bacterium]
MNDIYQRIFDDPEFQALQRRRSRLVWCLSAVMLTTYFGFILVIAFAPTFFAVPLGADTVITRGIPIGVGIILLGLALTGIYVHRANGEFDATTAAIVRRLGEERA